METWTRAPAATVRRNKRRRCCGKESESFKHCAVEGTSRVMRSCLLLVQEHGTEERKLEMPSELQSIYANV